MADPTVVSSGKEQSDADHHIDHRILLCDSAAALSENENFQDHNHAKPGNIDHVQWIYMNNSEKKSSKREITYGKWLVFKNFDEINETWSKIVQAIKNDELQGCHTAKCSTLMFNPSACGPGPRTTAVIDVYTSEHDVDTIGFKLIELVKQDIKYKTEVATEDYKYVHAGCGKCTIKTIYYNSGKPSFKLEGNRCFGWSRDKKDIWRLNVVECPVSSDSVDHGRWILTLKYTELTDLWHFLKKNLEKFGALTMVCPSKQDESSRTEKPVFHVYTTKENMRSVGSKLIKVVQRDIMFKFKQGPTGFTTLYWNDGEPDYETVRRKGITKNWRTGEDMK